MWRPEDFADDSTWSFDLDDDARQALVEHGRGAEVGILGERIADQSRRWSDLLTSGPGFVRLRGFPVEVLDADEIERAYLGLASLLGTPVGQDRNDNLITHIRDERKPPGPAVRKYQTTQSQDFHSDASDVVGLLCLRPSRSGGRSMIVSAHAVYNEMLRRAPDLVAVMYETMPWSRHTEQRPGEPAYFELAPITEVDGMPRISMIGWYIRQSQHHPTAPRLTADQRAAIDLAEEVTNSPDLRITMEFRPGDIQLLNNTTVLHARESYVDDLAPELRRHLLRAWVRLEKPVANEVLRGRPAAVASSLRTSVTRDVSGHR
ncbi:TauD/TfdA family dioxygenase [Nocardioides sp. W7]|uniref:TauD/TfdA family dioxygenase n=1 Tax=Nocardioides sp. W7 TaxID=2931390 RepID=UPI001FCFE82E|nr:TauD/TfdA family dioxygenase [Nocardioides sp. W7]